MEFSSKLLENAVNEVAMLPGIGKRTAMRLVLHLLKQPAERTLLLTDALTKMRNEIVKIVTIFLILQYVKFAIILQETIQ
jgi:recombination protein RecR